MGKAGEREGGEGEMRKGTHRKRERGGKEAAKWARQGAKNSGNKMGFPLRSSTFYYRP